MSATGLKKGITYVLIANIVNLIFNLISNFVLPKFLSVDAYADIKTFQLISSYIGVLSFGYVDGIYLKYGGNDIREINDVEIGIGTSTFRISQVAVTIILLLISFLLKDKVFIISSLVIISLNMTGYIKSLYQATGEFGRYARATNYTALFTFIANVVLLFVFSIKNDSILYLLAYVIIDFLIWIYLEIELCVRFDKKINFFCYSNENLISNSKSGILLMLGNFSSILLTSMDRWFVKALFNTMDFALYSFAVSIEGFLNVAITPITVTLYNYFCKNKDPEDIKCLHGAVEIFAVFLVCCSFPAKLVLELFIPKYYESIKVMFLLFGAQIFYIIVKSIYVNLYKARSLQKIYFIKLISVIVVGFVLNLICYFIYPYRESFAIATLLSAVYWFLISLPDFTDVGFGFVDFLYPSLGVVLLIICGVLFNSIIGFLIYFIVMTILTFLLRRKYLKYLGDLMPGKVKALLHIKNKSIKSIKMEEEK